MNQLDADYWNNRFATNSTPWNIGYISTPLKTYFDQLTDKNISILIPGCGNGYEAAYLLENGFTNITLIDISVVVTSQAEEKFSPWLNQQLKVITGDFFEMKGQYDLIVEQTFFCAIEPSLRESYSNQMHQLLQPGGKLTGVLFNHYFTKQGPPFGGDMNEYRELFAALFEIRKLEDCYNSIAPRAGSECFFILQKKRTTILNRATS
jgi:SAM-dependent methyltransferase